MSKHITDADLERLPVGTIVFKSPSGVGECKQGTLGIVTDLKRTEFGYCVYVELLDPTFTLDAFYIGSSYESRYGPAIFWNQYIYRIAKACGINDPEVYWSLKSPLL